MKVFMNLNINMPSSKRKVWLIKVCHGIRVLIHSTVQEALTEANDAYDAFTKQGPSRELQPVSDG